MKKALYAVVLVLLTATGCKQDIDLTADYQNIAVVYGLLNATEQTHYLRVQKGYLIDGNAYTAAGVADSIYYTDDLKVQLVSYKGGNIVGQPIVFTKTTLPKDSGQFANAPNIVYTSTQQLFTDRQYKLMVINNATGDTVTTVRNADNSEGIKLVTDFTVAVPPNPGFKYNLKTTNFPKVVWYTADNAAIYDVRVRFPYREFDIQTNDLLKDTFMDLLMVQSRRVEGTAGSTNINEDFNGITLMNTLRQRLPANPQVYRTFNQNKGMTFYFAAGGTELSNYLNAQNAQGGGLASNEALPPYTNISGGYGLLSSRYYKQVDSILLTPEALDTLACNPLTNGLNFRRSNGQFCQ